MKKLIGFLSVAFLAVLMVAGTASAAIIEVTPTYGTAVIDGNIGEWNLATDVNIPMYIAGDPTKATKAYAYLRYDYANSIMNVLVLQNGYPGNAGSPYLLNSVFATGNAWAYLNASSTKVYNDGSSATYPPDGTLPNLAWVPQPPAGNHSVGYEAAFSLPNPSGPSYNTSKFVVHVEYDANPTGTPQGGTAGSEGFKSGAENEIVLHLPPPIQTPEPATLLLLGLGLVGMGVAARRRFGK